MVKMDTSADKPEAGPAATKAKKEKTPEELAQEAAELAVADLQAAIALIKKGVGAQESRFLFRALRTLRRVRRSLSPEILATVLAAAGLADKTTQPLLTVLGSPSLLPSSSTAASSGTAPQAPPPEVELFLHLAVVIYLLDQTKIAAALDCATALIKRIPEVQRRTSDEIAAKAYFFYARAAELTSPAMASSIRPALLEALRTATLRSDESGQATLINLLLRNYLNDNLVEQADLLNAKATFPASATNNEAARYYYYCGRIQAIQLDYTLARVNLEQASLKAPKGAHGFLQVVFKSFVIVKMLLGEIPDRAIFRRKDIAAALKPYFQLTQAVRVGDVAQFAKVIELHGTTFQRDRTYTLIMRLRHNVIKTAIRMISISYSRITLGDVATKLQLDSAEDAEYIVAKAIRDGVIDATIDHEGGFVQSRENVDVYATSQPLDAFHKRIDFCLQLHNEAVKAMRFPPNAYRRFLESADERRERELMEAELMAEVEEDAEED